MGEAGSCGEPDVAGSDHRDLGSHDLFSLLTCRSEVRGTNEQSYSADLWRALLARHGASTHGALDYLQSAPGGMDGTSDGNVDGGMVEGTAGVFVLLCWAAAAFSSGGSCENSPTSTPHM